MRALSLRLFVDNGLASLSTLIEPRKGDHTELTNAKQDMCAGAPSSTQAAQENIFCNFHAQLLGGNAAKGRKHNQIEKCHKLHRTQWEFVTKQQFPGTVNMAGAVIAFYCSLETSGANYVFSVLDCVFCIGCIFLYWLYAFIELP